MKRLIIFFALCCMLFAACKPDPVQTDNTTPPAAKAYISQTEYVHNDLTDRNIYAVQTYPSSLEADQKIPVIIYVHGGSGEATSFQNIYRELAEYDIAGFSFECCGGNSNNPKSDGAELFSSHYTSRMSDLDSVIARVKQLDYVDKDSIYLFGESYGGIVVSLSAARHSEIAGVILVSTGLQQQMMGEPEDKSSYIASYDCENAFEEIKKYGGDVICFNGQNDETGAHDAGLAQMNIYKERGTGRADFYSLENSGHSYAAFSAEAKQFTLNTIISFVNDR